MRPRGSQTHHFVFPAFCFVKFLTIRGCCRHCLCILCSKSLTFYASDENRRTILQAAAHSQPATRDVSSVLKPMFQSGISSSTSWAFYPRVRGAESEFLVWSFFNATECHLPTYEGSFCCGEISESRLKQNWENFFFFFRRKRVME